MLILITVRKLGWPTLVSDFWSSFAPSQRSSWVWLLHGTFHSANLSLLHFAPQIPSVHLSSPVWGEAKPAQLVGEKRCLSLDLNCGCAEGKWTVITISSHLHDRSCHLIKALKSNASNWEGKTKEDRGRNRTSMRHGALQHKSVAW